MSAIAEATAAVDLSRFCATADDPRDYLRSPWKRGEWVYATNGHLCVRVPAQSMPDVAECAKAPAAQSLFQKHIEQRECEFLLLPKLAKVKTCGACGGTGAVMQKNGNVRLGESTYSLVYLSWLAALPQIRVCPGNSADNKYADQIPAVFIFDGGQALLMPRKD